MAEVPRCPEGCENVTPPFCHCSSCGETGIPLGPEGCCDDCVASDVVEELEDGLSCSPGRRWETAQLNRLIDAGVLRRVNEESAGGG